MKKTIFTLVILLYFFSAAHVLADNQGDQDASTVPLTPLQQTILNYKTAGYDMVVGPVQYMGRSDNYLRLYNRKAVAYESLNVVDETGADAYVRRNDFVYLFLKDNHAVLVRTTREVANNV
jgi:hypothetical protein